MKLLIQGDRIAGTATDAYLGPMEFISSPEEFNQERINDYRLIDGELVIPPPQVVSMRQGRLALLSAGLLEGVEAAIAAIEDATQRKAVDIEWEYSQVIDRESPLVSTLAASMGLTEEQMDQLFVAAGQL
jgi:hypothetical protein